MDLVHFGHCYAKLAADVLEQNLGLHDSILFNALASWQVVLGHLQPSPTPPTNPNLPYLAALQAKEAWFGRIKALTAGTGKMPGRVCAFSLGLCRQPGLMTLMLMTCAADIYGNISQMS